MSDAKNLDGRQDDERDTAEPADLHDLAAAYAVDAVDDAERAAFETHLGTCLNCQLEVAELSEVAVALSAGLDEAPPPALRERLLAQVAATPQDTVQPSEARLTIAPESPSSRNPTDELADRRASRHRRPGRFNRWALGGVAAAALAVGAIAVTQWPEDTPDPSIVAVQEVLDAPDAVRASGTVDGTTVTVVTAYSINRSVVLTEELAGAPEGQDYQLWFVRDDGTAVSAGMLPRDGDQFLLEGEPGEAVALAITLEPTGGSEQPTSEPLVAVPLEG